MPNVAFTALPRSPESKSPLLAQRTREKWGTRFLSLSASMLFLAFHDFLLVAIPDGYTVVEVGEVGQVAADGGVVAENFVFGDWLACAHGVVEVGLVIDGVAVAGSVGVRLAFGVNVPLKCVWFGMILVPLLQVLIAQLFRPTVNRIAFGLGARVFRLVG